MKVNRSIIVGMVVTAPVYKKKDSEQLVRLEQLLLEYGSLLVAYSGGVDSAVVAAAAAKVHGLLGQPTSQGLESLPMLAVVANAESYAAAELKVATDLAQQVGFPCEVVEHTELASQAYLANEPDRCYHCRSALADRLKGVASKKGFKVIADGLNADDEGDYRPGVQATDEAGFKHPLLELGYGKNDIRALARELGLGDTFAARPANACLSSRVPHGTPITAEILKMVEEGEAALTRLGFIGHRVRYHEQKETGNVTAPVIPALARIELRSAHDMERLTHPEMREMVVKALKVVGFKWVALDLQGYQMGSMNLVDE